MDDELLDDEQLLFALLKRDIDPGTMVAPEVDITTWEQLPYATFFTIAEPTGNGPGLWSVLVSFNAFGVGSDGAFDVCKDIDRVLKRWDFPGNAVIPGLGGIEDVQMQTKFSRVQSVELNGKNVTQYSGSYALIIRYIPTTP